MQGTYYVTATVAGFGPVYFTERNNDLATGIKFLAGTPSATVASAYGPLPNVVVTDGGGMPVVGATVTFAVAAGSNGAGPVSSNSVTVTTGSNGQAMLPVSPTANTIAGTWTLVASVQGVATPAYLTLTNKPGALNKLVPAGGHVANGRHDGGHGLFAFGAGPRRHLRQPDS